MKNLFLILLAGTLLTSCAKNNQEDVNPDGNGKPGTETAIPNLSATTFVGNEVAGSTDGVGAVVKFNQIMKMTADQAGNIYVLDGPSTFKIRKVSAVGVTTTIYNSALQSGTKMFKLLDIVSNAEGVIYVLANWVEYLPGGNGPQMANREYGVYKLETNGDLKKVSATSVTIADNNFAWVEAHNLVNNIALDAAGNIYGAYTPAGSPPPIATKVYQITPTPGLINANTGTVYPATLTGDAAGTLYASTATNIVKITASGASSVFTFPAVKSTYQPKVVGSQSGNIFVYGDIYNTANEFKGTGFYKVKADGTIVSKAIMPTPKSIVAMAAGASGKFYYAIQLNQGGYMIYKTQFD
jgi:hypothetical protein